MSDDLDRAPDFPIPEPPRRDWTVDEQVDQMRKWVREIDEAPLMLARVVQRCRTPKLDDLAAQHPDEFQSLFDALEIMAVELPEPGFPWPT